MDAKHLVILGLMLAVLAVLVVGLVLMVAGGKANQKYSNKLMVMRVVLQGLVLLTLVILFATK